MRRFGTIILLLTCTFFAMAQMRKPSGRIALIIENSNYQHVDALNSPWNDAALVADALRRAHFEVLTAHDLDKAKFDSVLQAYKERAAGAEVALIYFAGHGLNALGENWLAPVDLAITSATDLAQNAVSQTQLLGVLEHARMRIVILDACRDSPFASMSNKPGLAAFEAEGVLLMYSAGYGRQASGGDDVLSPFAKSFARLIAQPGLPLQMLPSLIRQDVTISTNGEQRPYASTSVMLDPLYLVAGDQVCTPLDQQWMKGLLASTDVTALRQFIGKKPGSCVSQTEAMKRITTLEAQASVLPPAVPNGFRDCPSCPLMIAVPGGSYDRGAGPEDATKFAGEFPVRRVEIAPFAASVFEVTFDEWDACVAEGGCGHYFADDVGWGRGSRPAVSVSWNDAKQYVRWLSAKTKSTYRLLSESEWEYAARGGTAHRTYWWGNTLERRNVNLGATDCEGPAAGGFSEGVDQWLFTAPVGSFLPNQFNLFDIIGNAWEWVEDCWHPDYNGAPSDGRVWEASCNFESPRMLRGGSWYDCPTWARAANRYHDAPFVRSDNYGFRVARSMPH